MEDPLTSTGERGPIHSAVKPTPVQPARNADKENWQAVALERLNSLTKPLGSLGRLEELAAKVVCIRKQDRPRCTNKTVYVFAADHGIAEEGVSAYPQDVTQQMVRNFLAGGAAINALARYVGAEVVVVDVGVDAEFGCPAGLVDKKVRRGTRNFTIEPAMTESEMNAALEVGRVLSRQERFQKSHLVAVGEMGIGSTTAASAITAALTGRPVDVVTGAGTGISSQVLEHKRRVIEKALTVNLLNGSASPFELLQKVGGLEIAAIAGMILAAREQSVPVVIDGFISTAAAAVAFAREPRVRDVLFAGHLSEEPGHRVLLEYLGLEPILNLRMRLGEGTGAALAMTVIEAALNIYNEMATFQSAGVREANP
jgi:nicotinate-nucleotide--dimethylbenzimidazole phosphoribosyltransferase